MELINNVLIISYHIMIAFKSRIIGNNILSCPKTKPTMDQLSQLIGIGIISIVASIVVSI